MKRIALALLVAVLFALSGGGWKWHGPPKAKAEGETPVTDTIIAEVTTVEGTEYLIEVVSTEETTLTVDETFVAEVDLIGDDQESFTAYVDPIKDPTEKQLAEAQGNVLEATVDSWGW